ncbi:MAG: CDP-alcohol phosphatidyltransferase family protein [Elusimicrobia bacterium]|nr:CDP-alcohol phosphatidyltransferase family protein [Elusimicrobiota bacterium]
MSLSNKITVLRIACTPFFFICLIYQRYLTAFCFFLASIATDALDGFYARKRRQSTGIGAFLDPFADKIFLIPTYIFLAAAGAIPRWLFIILVIYFLALMSRLAFPAAGWEGFEPFLNKTVFAVAAATFVSFIDYLFFGSKPLAAAEKKF